MSAFDDALELASDTEVSEMGETIRIDGREATAIMDHQGFDSRQSDAGGQIQSVETTIYIQKAEWHRVGGRKNCQVTWFDGDETHTGYVDKVRNFGGGQYALTIAEKNPKNAKIPGI